MSGHENLLFVCILKYHHSNVLRILGYHLLFFIRFVLCLCMMPISNSREWALYVHNKCVGVGAEAAVPGHLKFE